MVTAFSFCSSDKPQAVRLAQWIRRLGGVENHQCLIVFPNSTDAEGIEGPLRQAFGYVEVMSYEAQLSGWPAGPNEQHARTAQFLYTHKRLIGPWLFMEAGDCVMVGSHWLNRMEAEYRMNRMPMLGALNNTVETATGRVVGKHTTGVAIYPQEFPRLCPLVRNMISTSAEYMRQNFLPPAFDCYYEAYTVPMTHVSRLIQHFWRSEAFREENGAIVCGNFRTPYGASPVVDPEAVLIHGSKDGSLFDILERRAGDLASANAIVDTARKFLEIHGNPNPLSQTPAASCESVAQEIIDTPPRVSSHPGIPTNADGDWIAPANTPTTSPGHLITEAELDADPSALPMPPFPKDSPEGRRAVALSKLAWVELQKHARKVGAKGFGIQRPEMTNDIILKEREKGKEAWTKEARPVQALPPPTPIEPVRQWNTGDGTNVPMSEQQAARMMQLRQQREAVGAA